MSVLTNQRHEVFAQELAKGASQTDAYEAAGYSRDRTGASRLSTNANIGERVAQLQHDAAERTVLTIAGLTEELEEARKLAISSKNASAAVSATMAKARLNGLLQQTAEPPAPAEPDLSELSPRDIARRIAYALRMGGIDPETALLGKGP